MQDTYQTILSYFQIPGVYIHGETYGSGHINTTYRITVRQNNINTRYILQKINTDVFTHPKELMENITRVTNHLIEKESGQTCLRLIQTRNNEEYHVSEDGSYYRIYPFLEGTRTFDIASSDSLAHEAAAAFAGFQKNLTDLPGGPLFETITDFHHTPKRFDDFISILEKDEFNRAATCCPEVDFILKRSHMTDIITDLLERGDIPERITHNDTKINNVMIHKKTHKAMCVIDLDTVMQGSVLYDFGDLVRTITSPVAEDEKDTSRVTLQINMFEAIAKGYLSIAESFLTPLEKENLVNGGKVITLETGMRFLADYLNGNRYFNTSYPEHNLVRARTQFKLLESIEKNEPQLHNIICSI